MNSFHFLRPGWLMALPVLLLLLAWLWRRQLHSRSWQAVCDPELLPHLLLGRSQRRANWPLWLLLIGILLVVTALAGPVWQRKPQPLFRQQSSLVILFDLSRSMQAADLKPSRFVRARLKISDLLRQRREGQTALIAFAGDAFTVTPLTDDQHTIEALLKSLTPELMPIQGSEPARAIELGQQLLEQAGLTSGRLLLVTDEDRAARLIDSATQLHQKGFELSVIGVGTDAGAPIPLATGGFYKDGSGNLVLPRLNERGLSRVAASGGGVYHRLAVDDSDLDAVLAGLDQQRLDRSSQTGTLGEIWHEEGVWLLWPLALLAALAFRRGWLMVILLLFSLPPAAQALSWQDLWQRPDQRGAEAFAQGDYPQAAEQFQDSRWQAGARYRAGDFAGAAEALAEPTTADDWYNKGNALARSGDLNGALKSYGEALGLESEHTDAQANKELIEKLLEQQDQDQQQKQNAADQQKESEDSSSEQPEPGGDPSEQQADSRQQGEEGSQAEQSESPDRQQDSSEPESRQEKAGQEETAEDQQQESVSKAEEAENQDEQAASESTAQAEPDAEEQRANQQLLQRIPDDPGGLLRRKFLYQYRERGQQQETDRPW